MSQVPIGRRTISTKALCFRYGILILIVTWFSWEAYLAYQVFNSETFGYQEYENFVQDIEKDRLDRAKLAKPKPPAFKAEIPKVKETPNKEEKVTEKSKGEKQFKLEAEVTTPKPAPEPVEQAVNERRCEWDFEEDGDPNNDLLKNVCPQDLPICNKEDGQCESEETHKGWLNEFMKFAAGGPPSLLFGSPDKKEVKHEEYLFNSEYGCLKNQVKDGNVLPIFFFHGLDSDADQAQILFQQLNDGWKPSYLCSWNAFKNSNGFSTNLWDMSKKAIKWLREVHNDLDEYQFVCFSTASVLCRIILQSMDDHKATAFISIAGPLAGLYGNVKLGWKSMYPDFVIRNIYKVDYLAKNQDTVTVSNLWNDPYHHEEYLKQNIVLPVIDGHQGQGEDYTKYLQRLAKYKKNWGRLQMIRLLASSVDDYIKPWQSSHLSYHKSGGVETILESKDRQIGMTLPLKEQVEKGILEFVHVDEIEHTSWVSNCYIVRNYLIPYLANKDKKQLVPKGKAVPVPLGSKCEQETGNGEIDGTVLFAAFMKALVTQVDQ